MKREIFKQLIETKTSDIEEEIEFTITNHERNVVGSLTDDSNMVGIDRVWDRTAKEGTKKPWQSGSTKKAPRT